MDSVAIPCRGQLHRDPRAICAEAAHTTRDIRKRKTTSRLGEAAERSSCWIWHRQTFSAESRDPSSSGLVSTADPPTGGSHGLVSKHPAKVRDHRRTVGTDGRAPRGETIALCMQESAKLT